jgi:hypothetical protein
MAEIRTHRNITDLDLMRNINYTLDENIPASIGFATGFYVGTPSSGTPIEVLESKGRLFASIAGASMLAMGVEYQDWFEQQNAQLRAENYTLKQIIQAIEDRLAYIEANIPKERVVILRELPREEAKKEIQQLFSTGRTLYYSDIVQELGIDLETVVDICRELQKDKEIGVDENALTETL